MKKRVFSMFLAVLFIVGLMPIVSAAEVKDTTANYVGYTNGHSFFTTTSYSVPSIYVVDTATYNKATEAVPLTDASGTVAYCFNKSNTEPLSTATGWWVLGNKETNNGKCLYTKIANVTGTTFLNNATKSKSGLSADEFREWIISVGLNGYPNNYSGFNTDANGNQILSDSSFRAVTQYAIWYYTDSYNPLAESKTALKGQELAVYNKLISTKLPSSITKDEISSIDLYLTNGPAFTNAQVWDGIQGKWVTMTDTKTYQNLLAVKTTDLPEEQLDLTIVKEVIAGDVNKEFTFEVTLKNKDGATALTAADCAVVRSDGTNFSVPDTGVVTVTLKHGQSVSIRLPHDGYSYTVKEINADDYTTEVYLDDATTGTTSKEATATGITEKTTKLTFINTQTNVDLGTGSLKVEKTVAADTDNVPESAYQDVEFDFTVVLTGADGQPYNEAVSYTKSDGTTGSWDAITNGTVQFKLKHNESITLPELPTGSSYTVTEGTTTGFSLGSSTNAKGVIAKDYTTVSTFINSYDNRLSIGGKYRLEGWKTWNHTGNVSSTPTSVALQIYKSVNGTETKLFDLTLNANGQASQSYFYTRSWPKYENGYEVQYYVKEVNVPEGYVCTVTDLATAQTLVGGTVPTQAAGMSVTNTFNADLLSTLVIQKAVTDSTVQTVTFTVTLSDTAYVGAATVQDANGERTVTFPGGTDNTITVTMLSDGTITIPKLFSNTTYTVQEVDIPTGYRLNSVAGTQVKKDGTATANVTLTTPDANTPAKVQGAVPNTPNDPYAITLTFTNAPATANSVSMLFSKQDVTGNELAGATIELRNAQGAVVETWVSDGTVHTFTVVPGNYTLVETAAPSGYAIATKIDVVVAADGTITADGVAVTGNAPIVMVDAYAPLYNPNTPTYTFLFSKQDILGDELAGATIELRDDANNVLSTWVSDGTEHKFTVMPGNYTLVETAAPDGYALATQIDVVVEVDGAIIVNGVTVASNAPIVMVDTYADSADTPKSETPSSKITVTETTTSDSTTAVSATETLAKSPKTGLQKAEILSVSLLVILALGVVISFKKTIVKQ